MKCCNCETEMKGNRDLVDTLEKQTVVFKCPQCNSIADVVYSKVNNRQEKTLVIWERVIK